MKIIKPVEIEHIRENIALSYIGRKAELANPGDFERDIGKAIAQTQAEETCKEIGEWLERHHVIWDRYEITRGEIDTLLRGGIPE